MDEIKEPITEIGDDPAEADVQETALVPVKQDWQQRHDDREHCVTQTVYDTWHRQAMTKCRFEMRCRQPRRQYGTIP